MLNFISACEMNRKTINQVTGPPKKLNSRCTLYFVFKHYFVELNFGKSCQFTSTTTTKWLLCWNLSVLLSVEKAEKKVIPLVSVAEELQSEK